MSSTITIKLDSNAEQIASKLAEFPDRMGKQIARAMDEVNQRTDRIIQDQHLRQKGGAHSVGVVSARLVQSVTVFPSVVSGNIVRSAIGSNVVYAPIHEFGFQGAVEVHSFTRKNKANDLFTGGRRGGRKRGKGKKLVAGISVVHAFTRQVDVPEKAMFRTGITEQTDDYRDTISLQIKDAWGEQTGTL